MEAWQILCHYVTISHSQWNCVHTTVCKLPWPKNLFRQNGIQSQVFCIRNHGIIFFQYRILFIFFIPDLSADPSTSFASVIIFIKTLGPPLNTCHQLLNSAGYSGKISIIWGCCCWEEEIETLEIYFLIPWKNIISGVFWGQVSLNNLFIFLCNWEATQLMLRIFKLVRFFIVPMEIIFSTCHHQS